MNFKQPFFSWYFTNLADEPVYREANVIHTAQTVRSRAGVWRSTGVEEVDRKVSERTRVGRVFCCAERKLIFL